VPAAITLQSVLLNWMLTCGLSVVVIWPVSIG
jgi:hypothetical protein